MLSVQIQSLHLKYVFNFKIMYWLIAATFRLNIINYDTRVSIACFIHNLFIVGVHYINNRLEKMCVWWFMNCRPYRPAWASRGCWRAPWRRPAPRPRRPGTGGPDLYSIPILTYLYLRRYRHPYTFHIVVLVFLLFAFFFKHIFIKFLFCTTIGSQ